MGIPENVCENEKAVLEIEEALNVNVKEEDIDICYQVKRNNSNPIIARFTSHKVKRALYETRVKLKNIKLSESSFQTVQLQPELLQNEFSSMKT